MRVILLALPLFLCCGSGDPELSGRVLGADGTPVEGARLEVLGVPPPAGRTRLDDVGEWPVLHEIVCDEEGAFVVDAPVGSSIAIKAVATGEASPLAIVHARDFSRGLMLVTSPVVDFGVNVRDKHGTAIRNASVTVYERAIFADRPFDYVGRRRLAARGRTDAEGRFRVPGPTVGPLDLVVTAPDRVRVRQRVSRRDPDVEVTLRPGVPLAGKVVDQSGAPVVDAEVTAVLDDLTVDLALTAADGSYRLGGVPGTAPFEVHVSAPGRGRVVCDEVKWAEGGRLDLVIQPVRTIRGRVLLFEPGRDLRPAAGVHVAGVSHPDTIVTGPDGGFAFEDYPLGSTLLGPVDPDLCAAQASTRWGENTRAFIVGPTDNDLDLVIMGWPAEEGVLHVEQDREPWADPDGYRYPDRNKVVAGTVLGPENEPIPFAWVQSLGEGGGPGDVTTDLRGRFRIEGCTPGPQRVTVQAAGYRNRAFDDVPEGSKELVLTLLRGETCSGRLVGPDGEPLPGLWVSAWPDPGGDEHYNPDGEGTSQGAVTGAGGEFTIEGLDPVPLCIRVTSRDPESWHGAALRDVPPGSTDLVLTARPTWFEMDIRIDGTVVDADGNAVVDAVVRAEPEGFKGRTLTDESWGEKGRFTLLGLWPGPHRITVTAKGYRTETRSPVLCGTTDLEITLRR